MSAGTRMNGDVSAGSNDTGGWTRARSLAREAFAVPFISNRSSLGGTDKFSLSLFFSSVVLFR